MVDELACSIAIHEREAAHPDALQYALESLQYRIGAELVAYLWNQKTPVVVEIKPTEERDPNPYNWDFKRLCVRARVNPVHIHSLTLDYHIAELTQIIRVPHFEYFPKDWVCKKCGCIVDGFNAPRLCDRCGAPRSPRDAMVEARGYA